MVSSIVSKARIAADLRDTEARFGSDRKAGLEWLETERAQLLYIAHNAGSKAAREDAAARADDKAAAINEYKAAGEVAPDRVLSAADIRDASFVVPQYKTPVKERMNARVDHGGRVYAIETDRVGMSLETTVWLNGRRLPETQRLDIRRAAEAYFAENRAMVAIGTDSEGRTKHRWTPEERSRRYAEFEAKEAAASGFMNEETFGNLPEFLECLQSDVAGESDETTAGPDNRLYNCMPDGIAPDWKLFDGLEIGACMDVSERAETLRELEKQAAETKGHVAEGPAVVVVWDGGFEYYGRPNWDEYKAGASGDTLLPLSRDFALDLIDSNDETCIEGGQYIEDAEFFSVYGHMVAGGVECITDAPAGASYDDALKLAAELATISGLPVTSWPPYREPETMPAETIELEKAAGRKVYTLGPGKLIFDAPHLSQPFELPATGFEFTTEFEVPLETQLETAKTVIQDVFAQLDHATALARKYARLAQARSPRAMADHDRRNAEFERRVLAGETVSMRERYKNWVGNCRAAFRDIEHAKVFNHSGFDISFRRDAGLYRPLFGAAHFYRINPETTRTYYADFAAVLKAKGPQYKRKELESLAFRRVNLNLTSRFPAE